MTEPLLGRAGAVMFRTLLALLLVAAALAGWPRSAAAQERPSLRIDPATQSAGPGREFVVNVIQSTAVETTGAQTDVSFDPKVLQMKNFELGPAYTSASAVFAFGNADVGTNASRELALGRANTTGVLENAAGFLLPGSGTIPVGETVFLKITFVAQPGRGAEVKLDLRRASMIDATGDPLDPILSMGTVSIGAGGAPGPGGSGEPPLAPTVAPSEVAAAPADPTSPVKVFVAPTSIALEAGMPARVFLVANADGNISSVATDLTFDKDKLEITGLEPGPAWSGAVPIAGVSSGGLDAAIAAANTTGQLQQAGVFFAPGSPDMPYGEGVFISVLVKGKATGTSSLSVGNAAALGVTGASIPVAIAAASFTKPPDKGVEIDPVLVGLLVILLALIGAGILAVRSGRIPVRVRRRWPYYVSMALGLIPVALFGGLVVMLLVNSAPVVSDPGVAALFGTEFSSKYAGSIGGGHFGLLPALAGSILITLVAVAVALPIALGLALVAVDVHMGPISRLVRPLVAVMSGIPPIVFAISVPIFITVFMIPKFAANSTFGAFDPAAVGADPATWPPPGVPFSAGALPWDLTGVANSTLLGGLLIAFFLIPFVTPLFADALRDVPQAAREASVALGANRTYTLRRVVLPRALPAMIGASMLAALKALGDTLIVGFAVGWSAITIPQPVLDVLERTTSLAGLGPGLILSLETLDAQCSPADCAIGYSSALLLLLFAGVMVLVISSLQTRGRRRVAT